MRPEPKHKIGDPLEVIGYNRSRHGFDKGDIVKVEQIFSRFYFCSSVGKTYWYYLPESEVKSFKTRNTKSDVVLNVIKLLNNERDKVYREIKIIDDAISIITEKKRLDRIWSIKGIEPKRINN